VEVHVGGIYKENPSAIRPKTEGKKLPAILQADRIDLAINDLFRKSQYQELLKFKAKITGILMNQRKDEDKKKPRPSAKNPGFLVG
jgi:hypothetical protein